MSTKIAAFVLAVSFSIMGCSSFAPPVEQNSELVDLLIANTTVLGAAEFVTLNGMDVVVDQGVIVEVIEHTPGRRAKQVIDGQGKYVIPGLIDAHTHPFPVERSFPQFIHYGVTGILVTGCSMCSNANLSAIRAMGENVSQVAPRVFHTSQHFTMEGRHPVKTYPSPNWIEGQSVFYLRVLADIAGYVAQVSQQPIVGIKLTIEKGPVPPFVEPMPLSFVAEVTKQAHAHQTKVFTHVSDNAGLEVAYKAGVDHLLHFTGVDLDWDKHADIIEDFVARDLHWVTTVMLDKSFLYPLNPAWIEPIRETGLFDTELDKLRMRGMPEHIARRNAEMLYGESNPSFATNPVLQKQFDDLRQLHARGIKLVTGTDVSNSYILPGYSLHEEMALLELGGFAPIDILRMATLNAAELVDADRVLGSVEQGKYADLVILNSDPTEKIAHLSDIAFVLKGGNPLRAP